MDEKLKEFIRNHRNDDVRELSLQASRFPDIDIRTAAVQISGWQAAKAKLPLWAETEGILFPVHLSMEQCSSQVTAEYKRSVCHELAHGGERFTDLTGGFGIDCAVIGQDFDRITFVERNEALCDIARNNLPLLGCRNAEVLCADCVEVLDRLPHQDMLFIDPARRDANGGKTVAISDCTPDVATLNDLLLEKADTVMIKLSPMLDIKSAERTLKEIREVHIVSVNGECKETLIVLRKTADEDGPIKITCANITAYKTYLFSFTREEEREAECRYTADVGRYIYEPNASLMKGCAFKSLAQRFCMEKLHPDSHLYTSDEFVDEFPGRAFTVQSVSSFSKKDVRQLLGDVKKANITVRNFPSSVAELRRRLKLAEGGDVYIFATTLADGRKVLIRGTKKN